MGRTIPSHRMALEIETSRIRLEMRKKLPDHLKPVLDRILDYPFLYASAGGMTHRLDAREPMLLSIILRHEKMLHAIRENGSLTER